MIGTIVRNGFLNLRRDRGALLLTFVLPIAFFTIFAFVFGGRSAQKTPKINIALVDEDGSAYSQRLAQALKNEPGLNVHTTAESDLKKGPGPAYDRQSAEAAVRKGDLPVAIILPKGLGAHAIEFGKSTERPAIELLSDSSDPIAPQMAAGLLQKVSFMAMPDVMAESGMKYFEQAVGGLSPDQRTRIDQQMSEVREFGKRGTDSASPDAKKQADAMGGFLKIESRDLLGEKKKNPVIAFYAAGVGVLFLLFTASGAAGALLDEADSGALDRILASRVSMGTLLRGKLVYLALLGTVQLTVMFLWGALAFKVELFTHLAGFFIMAVITALAASAFGLMLAAASRTRAQQGALSTLIILIMSALGGSMFPRFIMPETLQKVGLITFNAWALDGFIKVFWREEPLRQLWPQVLVLALATVVFFAIARRLARRWEYS